MINKGGAEILEVLDDFCDFFSLERVYGVNRYLAAANDINMITTIDIIALRRKRHSANGSSR
jgi:hypothetical protein